MSGKNVLRFGIAFFLSIVGIYDAFYMDSSSNLWWWSRVVWGIVWTIAAVWNLLTRESRIPYALGILAAIIIGIVLPNLLGIDLGY